MILPINLHCLIVWKKRISSLESWSCAFSGTLPVGVCHLKLRTTHQQKRPIIDTWNGRYEGKKHTNHPCFMSWPYMRFPLKWWKYPNHVCFNNIRENDLFRVASMLSLNIGKFPAICAYHILYYCCKTSCAYLKQAELNSYTPGEKAATVSFFHISQTSLPTKCTWIVCSVEVICNQFLSWPQTVETGVVGVQLQPTGWRLPCSSELSPKNARNTSYGFGLAWVGPSRILPVYSSHKRRIVSTYLLRRPSNVVARFARILAEERSSTEACCDKVLDTNSLVDPKILRTLVTWWPCYVTPSLFWL